jgi:hypothetical protein
MTGSSDESDYSDIEELPDDGDYVPTASISPSASGSKAGGKNKGRKPGPGEFRNQGVLKQWRTSTYSTFSLLGESDWFKLVIIRAQAQVDMIQTQQIDLDPEYQRGASKTWTGVGMRLKERLDVVWVESKQIGLIDSIFRNYYISPVIFGSLSPFTRTKWNLPWRAAVASHEDGTVIRTCIDGKQVHICILVRRTSSDEHFHSVSPPFERTFIFSLPYAC